MAALAGAAVFLAAVLIRVFSAPFRIVGRVLFNTLLGFYKKLAYRVFGINGKAYTIKPQGSGFRRDYLVQIALKA